eukprot:TRINITY_DN2554_c1_g1_i1.p2 TRINITY_DN2554_c1_g1~~TRINITY_DN2554_c1_g1_i1.p2  ORF type:complete len:218 (+),score=20.34 TRINITY_DN2554_c1_g1_i1:78-731(+)
MLTSKAARQGAARLRRLCLPGQALGGAGALGRCAPRPTAALPTPCRRHKSTSTASTYKAAHADGVTHESLSQMPLKQRLKLLGPPAIAVYLIIHCTGFWLMWAALAFGLPVRPYLEMLVGDKVSLPKGPWAEWGLALVANKMLCPLQAMATVALTPRVAPALLCTRLGRGFISFVARWSAPKAAAGAAAPAAAATAATAPAAAAAAASASGQQTAGT